MQPPHFLSLCMDVPQLTQGWRLEEAEELG